MTSMGKPPCLVILVILTHVSALYQDYNFISGTAAGKASFLGNNLMLSSAARSRIECCAKCSLLDSCMTLTYQTGLCDMYSGYMPPESPVDVLNYVIYKEWCAVYSGFIYIRHFELCYRVMPAIMSCSNAIQTCSMQSATPIKIDSQEKQTFFQDVLENEKDISSSFIVVEDSSVPWIELVGSLMTYNNWDLLEPSGLGLGECISMEKAYGYRWHDNYPSNEKGVICEQREP